MEKTEMRWNGIRLDVSATSNTQSQITIFGIDLDFLLGTEVILIHIMSNKTQSNKSNQVKSNQIKNNRNETKTRWDPTEENFFEIKYVL